MAGSLEYEMDETRLVMAGIQTTSLLYGVAEIEFDDDGAWRLTGVSMPTEAGGYATLAPRDEGFSVIEASLIAVADKIRDAINQHRMDFDPDYWRERAQEIRSVHGTRTII